VHVLPAHASVVKSLKQSRTALDSQLLFLGFRNILTPKGMKMYMLMNVCVVQIEFFYTLNRQALFFMNNNSLIIHVKGI
jgi:hypothetical protein